ncbi:MAG: hypothetical protein ABSH13_18305 [Candidatus Acidiferrum sp.]
MSKLASCFRPAVILFQLLLFMVSGLGSWQAFAQSVPYAREFHKSKEDVDKALKELGAYSGQKLPIVDGFVATGDRSLDHFERAFYQFSVDVLPGSSGGTVVRLSAKITAWYADREPWKSGYQSLPSNGRLELDFLDRLSEKFGEKPVASVLKSQVQAPAPKLDLSTGLPRRSLPPTKAPGETSSTPAPTTSAIAASSEELNSLRKKREAEENRMSQLAAELRNLQDIQHNQARPPNLVVVRKNGTPVLARPAEDSPTLFAASADDEFEFLDVKGEWVHVQISGASRGFIRRGGLELPELVAERFNSPNTAPEVFRIEREETSVFPGDWESLRGKSVKIVTVQPISQDPKETGPSAKLLFASSLFKDFPAKLAGVTPPVGGVVIIFDSADGGMISSTLLDVQQFSGGALSNDDFWKRCYLDPPEAFKVPSKSPK